MLLFFGSLSQLPVPIAVLFLMYREGLILCCPSDTPRLLDKDELAMESQGAAEGPETEPKDQEAGGKDQPPSFQTRSNWSPGLPLQGLNPNLRSICVKSDFH